VKVFRVDVVGCEGRVDARDGGEDSWSGVAAGGDVAGGRAGFGVEAGAGGGEGGGEVGVEVGAGGRVDREPMVGVLGKPVEVFDGVRCGE
jgi:hypothetical protein